MLPVSPLPRFAERFEWIAIALRAMQVRVTGSLAQKKRCRSGGSGGLHSRSARRNSRSHFRPQNHCRVVNFHFVLRPSEARSLRADSKNAWLLQRRIGNVRRQSLGLRPRPPQKEDPAHADQNGEQRESSWFERGDGLDRRAGVRPETKTAWSAKGKCPASRTPDREHQ